MRLLYLTEPGATLSKEHGKLVIKKSGNEIVKSVGLEKIDSIVMLGPCHISTGLATDLLEREISVTWLSSTGKFFGRLDSTTGYNIDRQLKQFDAWKSDEFRLNLSKSWIRAKIRNSITFLRRANREKQLDGIDQIISDLDTSYRKIANVQSLNELMGYEGVSSKIYFKALSELVPAEFKFDGRSRRPPKDPFNSLLSFGYTLLLYEIFAVLTSKGLQPYLGFMHQPRRGHPSLASDLMEEWRAVLVDSISMALINQRQLRIEHFQDPDPDTGGIYLTRDAGKTFIEKFESKLRGHNSYLTYVDYPLSFRESLEFQVGALVKAIESQDATIYRPIIIR